MNYLKSSGFFSLFYVFVFFCLTMGTSMFLGNHQVVTIVVYIGLAIYAIGYVFVTGLNPKKTFRIHSLHIGSIFLLILLAFTIRPAAGFISQIGELFFHDVTSSNVIQQSSQSVMLSLFTIGLMPGIVEELVFRGVIYSGMRKARPVKGILLTAFFFGFAHMNFHQFCYAFFIGIIFGLALEATDSIFASMIMHVTFNASSILLTHFLYSSKFLSQALASQTSHTFREKLLALATSFPIAFISLGISLLILIWIAHLNGRLGYMKTWFQKDIRKSLPRERATSISYFAALTICFLYALLTEFLSYLT